MSDSPERAPLQELQVPQGLNLADPAHVSLLQQLLHAQNAANVSQAPQNSQIAVAGKPDKQSQKGNAPRANWTQAEEKCLAELKLKEANKERDGRSASKGHKRAGKMVKSTVCRSLQWLCIALTYLALAENSVIMWCVCCSPSLMHGPRR